MTLEMLSSLARAGDLIATTWDDRAMARPRDQRIKDTLELLQTEDDAWIATASTAGKP